MFEAAELGRKVSKEDFKRIERDLHTRLIEAQQQLRHTPIQVYLIVAGVSGAGKSEVVNRLNEWLDTRLVRTTAFWDETDEERERPYMWRFWRSMPARGTIGIMFGSWYTQPTIQRAFEEIDDDRLDRTLDRIAQHERMLADDGALVLKFWLHLPRGEQCRRLKDAKAQAKKADHGKPNPFTFKHADKYEEFVRVTERIIRRTDTGDCPWYVIEASDKRYRDLTVGQTLLDALTRRLERHNGAPEEEQVHEPAVPPAASAAVTVLDKVDLDRSLEPEEYKKRLRKLQRELYHLAWLANSKGRSTMLVFEGWDGSGKGGAIRRVTRGMDARLFRVISVGAPSDEEREQHYLWRFWRQVPRAGYFTIYDRSWYGRVLVERVEGLAGEAAWSRGYHEINEFEEALVEHGITLLKFWLHIDADEQLGRFEDRQRKPWKRHKITADDWRNRDKWDLYKHAVNDMVERTSSAHAPWHLVAGNDKRHARITVLETIVGRLDEALR